VTQQGIRDGVERTHPQAHLADGGCRGTDGVDFDTAFRLVTARKNAGAQFVQSASHRAGNPAVYTWAQTLQGYGVNPDVFSNPANPLRSPLPTDPQRGTTVNTAYALNRRLWDTFAPGAFPLDNLEIPERTVLAVEAGNAWQQPSHAGTISAFAALTYGDTTDRIQGAIPYISPHGGRMAVVAIDGHTVLVKVAHYDNSLPHDTLYGRLGGTIYNWNGGYLNGQTDKPNRE
jgi:hypothetical protein